MAEIIKDGRTGDTVRVDSNNRFHTQSLSVNATLHEHLESNAYDVSTAGLINLTNSADNALIYVKNAGDLSLIIETIFIDSGASTDGVGAGTMNWRLNPDGGTLIDDESPAAILNRRIGSPENLSVAAYKATAGGQTLTGGDTIQFPLPDAVGIPFAKPFIVPKGQAFGVSYSPPAGNTSMDIQVGLLIIVDTTGSI